MESEKTKKAESESSVRVEILKLKPRSWSRKSWSTEVVLKTKNCSTHKIMFL